ncbi:cytochrome c [soil metagenome]|jgi:mono/diheme cytochrome c family protein
MPLLSLRPPSPRPPSPRGLPALAALLALALLLSSCGRNMYDQPKKDTYEPSSFFEDGASARPLVEGTVARGFDLEDEHRFLGTVDGQQAETFPYLVDRRTLERGQERYTIFCAQCHGILGDGNGVVVQRGFPQPQTYHSDRLRQAPVGYFFNVISNGFGRMYPYGDRVNPDDRWAITAYIRALQVSQSADLDDLAPGDRERLENMR